MTNSKTQEMSIRHAWQIAIIPSDFAKAHPGALRTVLWLALQYGNSNGAEMFPTNRTVADALKISRRQTVNEHIGLALEAGWLRSVGATGGGVIKYEIAFPDGVTAFAIAPDSTDDIVSAEEFFAEVAA